jgi:hypothetical protein
MDPAPAIDSLSAKRLARLVHELEPRAAASHHESPPYEQYNIMAHTTRPDGLAGHGCLKNVIPGVTTWIVAVDCSQLRLAVALMLDCGFSSRR